MNIQGRIALITGAASGLGEATARLLAHHQAKVILLDVNKQTVLQLAAELNGHAYVCNVANEDEVQTTFDNVLATIGVPQIVINCAGIAPARRMISREGIMPFDHFHHVIHVNLLGTFNIMRLAAAAMSTLDNHAAERGVIINTASIAAYEGQVGQTAYSAAKGGVVGMTLPAARELASLHIRVMTIAPGIMSTPMMANMPTAVQDSLSAQIPFPKRLGDPNEYAELARHIIENPYLNGSVIRLDGAIRMQPR